MALKIKEGVSYKMRNGEKVGPMVSSKIEGWPWEANGGGYDKKVGTRWAWRQDGSFNESHNNTASDYDLISEWTEGPIRTVTRREPVSGKYSNGDVDVSVHPDGQIQISVSMLTLKGDRVRSACMVLSQLAEFLDEDKGDE